jgi:hypothetical protein
VKVLCRQADARGSDRAWNAEHPVALSCRRELAHPTRGVPRRRPIPRPGVLERAPGSRTRGPRGGRRGGLADSRERAGARPSPARDWPRRSGVAPLFLRPGHGHGAAAGPRARRRGHPPRRTVECLPRHGGKPLRAHPRPELGTFPSGRPRCRTVWAGRRRHRRQPKRRDSPEGDKATAFETGRSS